MAPAFTEGKMRFAAKLLDARKRAGFSQERAAAAVGTSRRHWIRWESGETMPHPDYLQRIAAVLDVDVAELAEEHQADDDEEAAPMPLTRDEYALYGALTARIVAAQHQPHPAVKP